jgi:hypothetical protein
MKTPMTPTASSAERTDLANNEERRITPIQHCGQSYRREHEDVSSGGRRIRSARRMPRA